MQPSQPNQAEPVPVQLTRIEGTINLIAFQLGELKGDVKEIRAKTDGHSDRLSALELANAKSEGHGPRIAALEIAHAATSGASTSWKTWLPILAALVTAAGAVIALIVKA
jgi:hypothetical protein